MVALFLVGFAVGQLGYGPASDRFGRRPVLIGSLGLYFVASLGCLVAPSLEWLGQHGCSKVSAPAEDR